MACHQQSDNIVRPGVCFLPSCVNLCFLEVVKYNERPICVCVCACVRACVSGQVEVCMVIDYNMC
jgi:hypothetical protein